MLAFDLGVLSANEKTARSLGLQNFSSVSGPDQIQDAVRQYSQLRALVRPSDDILKSHNLSRSGFQKGLKDIVSHSQNSEHFNLSDLAPDPKTHAGIAAGIGALGTGALAYNSGLSGLKLGLPLTALGSGAAYLNAANKRQRILNTAKLMKEYGLLKPEILKSVYPLLADEISYK